MELYSSAENEKETVHILYKAKYGNEIRNPKFNLHVHNQILKSSSTYERKQTGDSAFVQSKEAITICINSIRIIERYFATGMLQFRIKSNKILVRKRTSPSSQFLSLIHTNVVF